MARTTPPPRFDALSVWPELAGMAATAVRLHPRPGRVEDLSASKLGGLFLWPEDEAWPFCDEPCHHDDSTGRGPPPPGTRMALVPVLQLRAEDFPELPFRPGTDLFQLLWCPLAHEGPVFVARPFAFWRKAADVTSPRAAVPKPEFASTWYLPRECRLHPERVAESPPSSSFTDEMCGRGAAFLEAVGEVAAPEEWFDRYDAEYSVCPSNKVGGLPRWIQDDETPRCECGGRMEYVLTLTDSEFNGDDYHRWCPQEDRRVLHGVYPRPSTEGRTSEEREALADIRDPARFFGLNGGSLNVFVCRSCDGWPVRSVYQR